MDGKWITDSEWKTGREQMMYGWRTDLLADSVPKTNGRQMDMYRHIVNDQKQQETEWQILSIGWNTEGCDRYGTTDM